MTMLLSRLPRLFEPLLVISGIVKRGISVEMRNDRILVSRCDQGSELPEHPVRFPERFYNPPNNLLNCP